VSTLAHELGHSMHTLYANNNNLFHEASYTIFLAEIASLVNEILLNRYCYNNAEKREEKLYYLNNLMEMIKGTLFRQTMFAEFEKTIHEIDEKGEVLTQKKLSSIYYDLNKKYYGEELIHDEEIKLEWMRISHFYNSFYVYKYATGISCAFKIAYDILDGKENAKENYLKFLSSGGKDYSLEILKVIDIDIVNDNTIDQALDIFEKTLKEFKELL
jgi:oligoendopeptidase F